MSQAIGVPEALALVVRGEQLSAMAMGSVIEGIMTGAADPLQVSALLACLSARGETTEEVAGAATAMRSLAVRIPAAPAGSIDTCGTGGDGAGTFNISTIAALVVAGAGVPVAKHGNRAATSRCGSAELLEALGIAIEIPPEAMAASVHKVGIGFLYARSCHPAMAAVAPIRKALAVPTIFNRLGPLTNPMKPDYQLLGVGRREMLEGAAAGLVRLGIKRAWVVHGEDGLDEISTTARTHGLAIDGPEVSSFVLEPGAHVDKASLSQLQGGDAQQNASLARELLAGQMGAARDIVVLNAAAALVVAGRSQDLDAGVVAASESLDSGAAADSLARWSKFTQEAAP